MDKLKKLVVGIKEKMIRKVFWLPESHLKILAQETKRLNLPNDSALMRQIISNMFQK